MMLNTTNFSQKLKSTAGITFIALVVWTITVSAILAFQERKWWITAPRYQSVQNDSNLNSTIVITTTTTSRNKTPVHQTPKIILAWTRWFHTEWPSPFGPMKCGQYKCLFTDNKKLFKVSDALLFHGADTDINRHTVLPKQTRPYRQLWGFQSLENPYVSRTPSVQVNIHPFLNNVFNLMLTYSRQADIRRCYGRMIQKTRKKSNNHDYFKGKTKLIAWVASGCYGGRLNFVRDLSKLVPVDLYGSCGNLSCPRGIKCWRKLAKQYKFYLSIENFICRDYVTEKLYQNAYGNNMVPIVVGGANYTDHTIAAPGSYIDAQEFPTMKALADYIIKVANNATLYNSYFKWKSSYQVDMDNCGHPVYLCQLCRKLHDEKWVTSKIRRIPDISRRWGANNENCLDYGDIFVRNKSTSQIVTKTLKSQLRTRLKY